MPPVQNQTPADAAASEQGRPWGRAVASNTARSSRPPGSEASRRVRSRASMRARPCQPLATMEQLGQRAAPAGRSTGRTCRVWSAGSYPCLRAEAKAGPKNRQIRDGWAGRHQVRPIGARTPFRPAGSLGFEAWMKECSVLGRPPGLGDRRLGNPLAQHLIRPLSVELRRPRSPSGDRAVASGRAAASPPWSLGDSSATDGPRVRSRGNLTHPPDSAPR